MCIRDRSYSLARALNDTLSALNYTEAREMRDQDESNLLVLALNEAPSVLLELGFIKMCIRDSFNCCGMDVHKNLVVATIGITDSKTNITEYFQRSFSTLNSDLYRLKDWLKSHHLSLIHILPAYPAATTFPALAAFMRSPSTMMSRAIIRITAATLIR